MAQLALSLARLRNEIDALAPNRSTRSDGWIGDAAHRSRPSRHNPNRFGVVCALDITDDPAGGCSIHAIAEQIRTPPQPGVHHLEPPGRQPEQRLRLQPYKGSNPHTRHVHFAVGVGPDGDPIPPYDDAAPWGVSAAPAVAVAAAAAPAGRTLKKGMKGDDVKGLQAILIGAGLLPAGSDDGIFGPKTHAAHRRNPAQPRRDRRRHRRSEDAGRHREPAVRTGGTGRIAGPRPPTSEGVDGVGRRPPSLSPYRGGPCSASIAIR